MWELLQGAFHTLGLSSSRSGPGADSALHPGPGSGLAGSSAAGGGLASSSAKSSSQQHPSLLGFIQAARDVLLSLVQEDVMVQVPVSFDARGLLLCIVCLARMVAQVHNLLLRGDLPLEEKKTLGFN